MWIDNLPYNTTLLDVVSTFAMWCAWPCGARGWQTKPATCSNVTGATLFRPQLSAATLLRRREAENDAMGACARIAVELTWLPTLRRLGAENAMLQEKCAIAYLASAAAREAASKLGKWAAPAATKRRGRPPKARGAANNLLTL